MQIERAPRNTRSVSLTPLIDIVFLLIVFFMLSTSFVMSESLELSMPEVEEAKAAKPSTPSKPIQLIIRDANTIQVGNRLMSNRELDSAMFRLLGNNPDASILILSTPEVTVQELVAVMDIVYLSGGRNVQIDDLPIREGVL